MITFTQLDDNNYGALYNNGVLCGWASRDVDGYFYFWFDPDKTGAHHAHHLRQIADTLDELNQEADAWMSGAYL